MKKRNVLISAVLTIALCLGVIAGSTYAIFTDAATPVDITATSGTVDIEATVSGIDYSSYNPVLGPSGGGYAYIGTIQSGQTGYFTNQGTVELDGNVITIDKITPGDKIEFDIVVKNLSNVATKVRPIFTKSESKLDTQASIFDDAKGIKITSTVTDPYKVDAPLASGEYIELAPSNDTANGQTVQTIHVVIEFVYLAADQNEFQGRENIKIGYAVEAIQYNGQFAN